MTLPQSAYETQRAEIVRLRARVADLERALADVQTEAHCGRAFPKQAAGALVRADNFARRALAGITETSI